MTEPAVETKLQIHKISRGAITYLRFVGVVDESFEGAGLAKGLSGQLIVSLGGVRRITSFGIRQWVDFVERASAVCSSICFVECAPRIIDQFNMVANFGGRGRVLSFYAPFRCGTCGAESVKLFQVDRDRAMITQLHLDGGACASDSAPLLLDDDAASYLSYLSVQPEFDVDPAVAAFLAGRTEYVAPDGMRKARVDKRVRDRYTFIGIAGDIGSDFPVQKVAEGLEGDVVLDLTAVGRVTPEGRQLWRSLVQRMAPSTERILVVGLPVLMLEGLSRPEDLADKAHVLSFYLPYSCPSCSITAPVEITSSQHAESIRQGAAPELACMECGRPTTCAASPAALQGMTAFPAPDKDLDTDKVLEWSRLPPEPAQAVVPLPLAPMLPAPTSHGRPWVLLAIVLLALATGLLGWRALLMRRTPIEKQATLIEASHPRPPSWRDQPFAIVGQQVLVSGQSGVTVDKEEGLQQARAAALEAFVHQISASIRDPLWLEHLGTQYMSTRAKAMDDLEKSLVSGEPEATARARKRVEDGRGRVAKSVQETGIIAVQADPHEFYWEKIQTSEGIRYRVWVLVRVSRDEFKGLSERFAERQEALSTVVVPYFPGMAWRYDVLAGAVVVGMRPDSPLRHIGVIPGDIITSIQDRAVKDSRGFKRVISQEHGDLEATGGVATIRIKRGDGPVVEHRLRVQKRVAVTPGPKGSTKHPVDGRKDKRPPPANIWDDNPFE
jgi:hypothetical protein